MRGRHYGDGWLTVRWSKKVGDFLVESPSKSDSRLVYGAFFCPVIGSDGAAVNDSLLEELKARGYDPETMEFSIRRKAKPDGNDGTAK